MKSLDALRRMMEGTGIGKVALSRAMGRTKGYIGSTLYNGGDLKVGTLAEAASAMGYELVLEGHGERISLDGPRSAS